MVIQNIAVPQGDALKVAIQRGALPVLVVFFVAVGTSLQLDALLATGFVAIALVAVRVCSDPPGRRGRPARVGHRPAERRLRLDRADLAGRHHAGARLGARDGVSDLGSQVQMLLVALIAIDELVGPALFRIGLARAGEIDAQPPRPLIVVSNREPYLHNYDERRTGSRARRPRAASRWRSTR